MYVFQLGVIYSTFAALRLMDKSKGGNGGLIVNISSIVSLDAYGAYAVYTASKYGVNGFTRALSVCNQNTKCFNFQEIGLQTCIQ